MKSKKIIICSIIIIVITTILVLFIYSRNVVKSDKTLFIYMCGSNLESKKGLASKNIDEILSAKVDKNVNIVIQTGGSKEWKSHDIKSDKIQRYQVYNGRLKLIKTLKNKNMGESKTLKDFLVWGKRKYKSDHYMLVIWDHGAGPIEGAAFDENYDFDALSLLELKSALKKSRLKKKFDIIGFDTCLMATLETASIVQDYAKYMIASEEIEPSGGWDYKSLVESYSKSNNLVKIGKNICDAYMQKCIANNKTSYPTLSLIDLSYTDEVLNQFNDYIFMVTDDISNLDYSYISEVIRNVEKFGGGDLYKSSANMFDLLDYLYQTSKYMSYNYVDMTMLLNGKFIKYSVHNENRNASGVSFFYPEIYNKEDIETYLKLNISKNYNKLLKDVFLNTPEKTLIISNKGEKESDDTFSITLSKKGIKYLNKINYAYMINEENKHHVLFIDDNIEKDWKNYTYKINNNTKSLALNDRRLFYKVVSNTPEFISYIAPIKLNGEKTNLNFVFLKDDENPTKGYYRILGTSKGYDENEIPDNDIIQLKSNDRIQVVNDLLVDDGFIENYSDEFILDDDGRISEISLDMNRYQYVFIISDIFGKEFTSDIVTFENNKIINIEKNIIEFSN